VCQRLYLEPSRPPVLGLEGVGLPVSVSVSVFLILHQRLYLEPSRPPVLGLEGVCLPVSVSVFFFLDFA
jgi:hypothetical protein